MASTVSNDTRGWILCVISAVACVAGACIVCVDVVIRLLPGQKTFSIQDSSAFLSSSLSLSFGVMIFSSLFSMLPSSKRYLLKDGHGAQAAGLLMMGSFAAGFVGMQVISRIIHRFMPSHVVDCGHSHRDGDGEHNHMHAHAHAHAHGHGHGHSHMHLLHRHDHATGAATEATPLLLGADAGTAEPLVRRPSRVEIQKRVLSFVKDVEIDCDGPGSCFGYTEPCGQECNLLSAAAPRASCPASGAASLHTAREPVLCAVLKESGPVLDEAAEASETATATASASASASGSGAVHDHEEELHAGDASSSTNVSNYGGTADVDIESAAVELPQHDHHHHVPANAFLSIGLQTVLAIGLHKFPEGFITFATNHANPALGFNVFLALFVHNIAEGFAMALPLYMALGSRLKAILWAAALGGLSQPLGAGVAALWLQCLGRGGPDNTTTDELGTAYGILFAATAGIMAAVALQLFVESLTLHHNRQLTVSFAFVGMMMLGVSSAIGGR